MRLEVGSTTGGILLLVATGTREQYQFLLFAAIIPIVNNSFCRFNMSAFDGRAHKRRSGHVQNRSHAGFIMSNECEVMTRE